MIRPLTPTNPADEELTHRLQMFADHYCAERDKHNVEGMAKELDHITQFIARSNQRAAVEARIDENRFSQRCFDGTPSTPADEFSKHFVRLIDRMQHLALEAMRNEQGEGSAE